MAGSHDILMAGTVSVALIHTLIGPDHYLPFIVLGRAEGWTLRKTLVWTFLCGVGHVLSSIVLGVLAVGLGWAVSSVQRFEALRGHFAALVLIAFGLIYFLWGLWRGRRGHSHVHVHADGSLHKHPHDHPTAAALVDGRSVARASLGGAAPAPVHERAAHEEPGHVTRHRRTLWVLFIIFVLGPCEPLIALLLAPASRQDLGGVLLVAGLFGAVTVATMLGVVALGTFGIRLVRLQRLERYAHALAGFAILVSGLMIQLLGV